MPQADVVRLALLLPLAWIACTDSPPPEPLDYVPTSAAIGAREGSDSPEASGGRVFIVAQGHPRASDDNPGTAARPWKTISRATGRGVLRPGDTVRIHQGVYRETVEPREGGRPGTRISFEAAPGETVSVVGTEPATGWTRTARGLWRLPWRWGPMTSYADERVFRRELLVAGGRVMRPADSAGAIEPGTFWVEGPPESPVAVLARFRGEATPEASGVEVASRIYLFRPLGPDRYAECGDPDTPGYFRISGIDFRFAANRAQWGAVCAGRGGSLVEDVTVEWTNGQGIDGSGESHVFRRTAANFNGQMGWGASCRDCLWEDTEAVGNNWKGYDMFWEAGGGKWSNTSGTTLRRHTAIGNGGPGIWFDIDNADNTIEGCVARGNDAAGVMLELRTVRTLVQHCEIAGTRWRDWTGTGILSQAASHNVLLHNTVRESEGSGLWLRLDPLRRAPDGHTWVVANRFLRNVADPSVEAREVSVEGLTPENVRSYRFARNAIRPLASGETGDRSTFFVHPTDVGSYRGGSIREWRRWVRDEGSVLSANPVVSVRPLALPRAGAPDAPARWARSAGAHPDEVGL